MRFGVVAVLLLAAVGCSRKPEVVGKANIASQNGSGQATANPPASTEGAHGSRKNKGVEVPVFVDGKPLAVLRHGELPASVVPRLVPERETKDVRYYRLAEYLGALGVATDRIKSVHLRGNGHRIASLGGDELAKQPTRFVFDFMEKDTGIARLRWDTTGLRNTFRVEEIRAVFVYVDRAAPELAPQRSCYVEDGACSDKVPYAEDEVKGTRVYLDGKLVGQVKRRRLGDELVVGRDEAGAFRFDMAKLLAQFGVDSAKTKAIELVSGDDVVGRGRGAELSRELTFVIPPHQHGRVRARVPQSWAAPADASQAGQAAQVAQPSVRDAEVTAVLVYRATAPKDRSLTALSDVPPPEETLVAENGD